MAAQRAAWIGRRMAGRAAARLLADPRRGARGGGRDRHSEDRRLQSGRQRGLRLFRGQPAPGRRWSAATAFLKPILKRPNLRLATGAHVERILFDGRRATGLRYSQHGVEPRGDGRRRNHSAGGRDRLAATVRAFRRRRARAPRGRSACSVIHALPGVGENLQDHLQLRAIFGVTGARTLNVDYQSLLRRGMMGLDYAAAAARAADHGAVAARPVRQVLARLRHRQHRIPRPAAVARPFRRAHAPLSGDHDQRLQSAAGEPRPRPMPRPPIRAPRR